MKTITLEIVGMQCDACVGHVESALRDLPGIANAVVDLQAARATVTFDPEQSTLDTMRNAIAEEGYEVVATAKYPQD